MKLVVVFEDGTSDPFSALYINGTLVLTGYTLAIADLLKALGHEPEEAFVPYGFAGHFPDNLYQLKTYPKPIIPHKIITPHKSIKWKSL